MALVVIFMCRPDFIVYEPCLKPSCKERVQQTISIFIMQKLFMSISYTNCPSTVLTQIRTWFTKETSVNGPRCEETTLHIKSVCLVSRQGYK